MRDLTTKTNGMGDLQNHQKGIGDLIEKGQNNQKGLIGAIAIGVITVGLAAINAISGK